MASEGNSEIHQHSTDTILGNQILDLGTPEPAALEPQDRLQQSPISSDLTSDLAGRNDRGQETRQKQAGSDAEKLDGDRTQEGKQDEERLEDSEYGDSESRNDDLSEGDSVDTIGELFVGRYPDFANLEARKKLLPKRAKQFRQYNNIIEERISFLEERCDWLDERAKKPSFTTNDSDNDSKNIKRRNMQMKLNYQFWDGFQEPRPAENPHVIDVLVGEPEYSETRSNGSWRRDTLLKLFDLDKWDGKQVSSKERSEAEKSLELDKEIEFMRGNRMPERIRFNSIALQHLLRRYFHSSTNPGKAFVMPGMIMLRPFKSLTHFEDDIKSLTGDVLRILENLRSTGSTQPSTQPSTQQSQKSHELEEKEIHLRESEGSKAQTEKEIQIAKEENDSHGDADAPLSIDRDTWSRIFKTLDLYDDDESCNLIAADWPTDVEVKSTLNCLLEFMSTYLKPVASQLRDREMSRVRFSDLWHLFRTGDEIITNQSKTNRNALSMRILRTNGGRRYIHPGVAPSFDSMPLPEPENRIPPVNNTNPFCVHAYYLSFDGTSLVPVRQRFVIQPYIGERSITELEAYPTEYAIRVNAELKDILIRRGKSFIKYALSSSVSYCDCKGEELSTKEELNDKVIVDPKEYYKTHQPPSYSEPDALDMSETSDCPRGLDCGLGAGCYHGSEEIIHDQDTDKTAMRDYVRQQPIFRQSFEKDQEFSDNLKDEDFALCDYRLAAYKLRSREWVQVHVDDLSDATLIEDEKGFERLVLPSAHKHIIKSQVKEHFRKKRMRTPAAQDDLDLVRGKGQGLIILLHGAPGVGKTCTAETIADLVRKPLYPITCGDLGSTAREVEQNLKQHFTLASRWDCVMLLDEADVFLAKRRTEDLDRNSIVSVFLRIMEYYKGLLFLTTNRVGTFDEAFKSRVHISLFYKNFDKKTTVQVWETFIIQTEEAIKKKGWSHFEIRPKEIRKFAKDHWKENPDARWNGRQIRNAFHTAIAMAEFDAQADSRADEIGPDLPPRKIVLGREQFAKIASTVKDFDRYLTETMGVSYEQRAEKERIRKSERLKEIERRDRYKKGSKRSKKSKKSEHDPSDQSSDTSSEEQSKRKKAPRPSSNHPEQSENESSSSSSSSDSD